MDYFNQLLESYTKLKKRTFKLVYLDEDETAAKANARSKALAMLDTPGSYPLGKHQLDVEVRGPGDIIATSTIFGGMNPARSYPSAAEFEAKNSKDFAKIVNSFMDPVSGEAANEVLEDMNPKLALEGGSYDEDLIHSKLDELQPKLTGLFDDLMDILKKSDDPAEDWKAMTGKKLPGLIERVLKSNYTHDRQKALKELVQNFIYSEKQGLGRILDGDKLIDSGELGYKLMTDTSPGLVYDTLEALNRVVDFVSNPNTLEDCASISGVISKVRGAKNRRVLIKLPSSNEGLIIPGDATMMSQVMARVSQAGCSDPIPDVNVGAISDSSINAKKGTLHEALTKTLFYLHKAASSGSDSSAYKKALADSLRDNKKVVEYLIGFMKNTNGWSNVEDERADNLVLLEDKIFGGKLDTDIESFLNTYYEAMKPVFDSIGADSIIHSGLSSRGGDRADNVFVFHSQEAAEKAAKTLGLRPQQQSTKDLLKGAQNDPSAKETLKNAPETVYTLGMGQKIYEHLQGSKLGEVATLSRINKMALGVLEDDSNVAPSFPKETDRRFPLHSKASPVLNKLNKDLVTIDNSLTKESAYIGIDGKRKKTDPKEPVSRVLTSLRSALTHDEIKELGLDDIDVNSPVGRSKLAELVGRHHQVATLRSMLNNGGTDGNIAKSIILRQAFSCGGNGEDIVQSIYEQESNTVHSFSHNYFFNLITNSKDVSVTVTGTGYNITCKGVTVRMQQEESKTKKGLGRETRTVLLYPKGVVAKASEEFSKGDVSDDLKELFAVQNRLLKKLIG